MMKIFFLNLMLLMGIYRQYAMPMEHVDFEDIGNRGQNTIAVEIVKSESNGEGGGFDEYGYIAYNEIVPKGETVISFVIYNPATTEYDDILYVIDNGKIR